MDSDTAGEIPQREVLAALQAVVSSAAFGKTPRPARFLRHLVETTLRGERHLLKESVLGTDVFERPASWDPRLDPIVRQEAARLRHRLANYYQTSGSQATIRIDLPVGSYVPSFRRKAVDAACPLQPIALGEFLDAINSAQPERVIAGLRSSPSQSVGLTSARTAQG